MTNLNLTIIKSLVLLVGGFVMVSVGVYFTISHVKFIDSAEQTTGIIIEVIKKRTAKGTNVYHPIVRYQPLEHEKSIEFVAKPGLWPRLYNVGEEVVVAYHMDNPHEAKIKSFWMLWFLPLITILFGLMCLLASGHLWQKRT